MESADAAYVCIYTYIIHIYIYIYIYISGVPCFSRRGSGAEGAAVPGTTMILSNAPKGNSIGATGSWNQTRVLEPGAKGS